MSAVCGPTIITTCLGIVADTLDVALAAVVAVGAEALQGRQPKGVPIAAVTRHVIDFGCGDGQTLALAEAAPRLDTQLMLTQALPAREVVPTSPMRMSIVASRHQRPCRASASLRLIVVAYVRQRQRLENAKSRTHWRFSDT